ncbi:MAG: hypothetical protein WD404_05780, partial [Solirubrobacterales bacterium]
MRVLAEIPARPSPELRPGSLRRCDIEAFERVLGDLGGARVVLVGDGDREGSFGALGLAAAAAAAGRRAALLECDLAKPRLAEGVGLARAPGLREHLRGEAAIGRILKPVVLAGPGSARASEPLVCVVAGRPEPDGARLLASPAFAESIPRLRAP